MAIPLDESLAVNEIAGHLYDFLPGSPHPYAAKDISFPGAAREVGLSHLWIGGSKRPEVARAVLAHGAASSRKSTPAYVTPFFTCQ